MDKIQIELDSASAPQAPPKRPPAYKCYGFRASREHLPSPSATLLTPATPHSDEHCQSVYELSSLGTVPRIVKFPRLDGLSDNVNCAFWFHDIVDDHVQRDMTVISSE